METFVTLDAGSIHNRAGTTLKDTELTFCQFYDFTILSKLCLISLRLYRLGYRGSSTGVVYFITVSVALRVDKDLKAQMTQITRINLDYNNLFKCM
jgi:hypothetical protein